MASRRARISVASGLARCCGLMGRAFTAGWAAVSVRGRTRTRSRDVTHHARLPGRGTAERPRSGRGKEYRSCTLDLLPRAGSAHWLFRC